MYNFILKMHSGWAFIALLLLVIAVVNALIGLSSKNPFTQKDRRISMFALIAVHVQFVFGLVLYFVSPNGFEKLQNGMANMDSYQRLLAVEHPFTNLIAIIVITIGWSRHKRTAEKKFMSISIFYTIGLLLLLSMIPWKLWFA